MNKISIYLAKFYEKIIDITKSIYALNKKPTNKFNVKSLFHNYNYKKKGKKM